MLAALGLVGSGMASVATPATAQTNTNLNRAEFEECQEALRRNTIEALEAFLNRYPDGTSECQVLALNALAAFGPGEAPAGVPGPGPNPGQGYGG